VTNTSRKDGRATDQLREIAITPNYLEQPYSSVLVEFGLTKVVCAVSIEEALPRWMMNEPKEFWRGWVTSEYSMLPFSSGQGRMQRESARGRQGGRTLEIQRLIGRSFRSVVRLDRLGQRTLWVDCDVLQADGGTRTASITGGFVALAVALEKMARDGKIDGRPWSEYVAAVSVGLIDGEPMLDLTYDEDYRADTDMNIVMTESGRFVEVQGTAEEQPFSHDELDTLLALGQKGIAELIELQKEAVRIGLDELWLGLRLSSVSREHNRKCLGSRSRTSRKVARRSREAATAASLGRKAQEQRHKKQSRAPKVQQNESYSPACRPFGAWII